MSTRVFTPEFEAEICALAEDYSPPEIARIRPISETAVRNVCARNGVKPKRGTPGRARLSLSERAETIRLYRDFEMSSTQIARILNRHPTVIRARLRRWGVLRTPTEANRLAQKKLSAEEKSARAKKRYHEYMSPEARARFQDAAAAAMRRRHKQQEAA